MGRKRYFKAQADALGVTICERHGGKGNYSWNKTNITYPQGQTFYVYEILDGWARVHGEVIITGYGRAFKNNKSVLICYNKDTSL